ncbi:MAG: selenium cofactor biosynthesis protein YqeC [Desulfosporosinus sp.]|nr:selenium cofactor biosynthesis protein YqeC [Desulfosporosinus sp.]
MAGSLSRSPLSWVCGGLRDMTGQAWVTTFIGAGGKTTCLQAITQEINAAGLRVTATTTTKVYPEEHMKVWKNSSPPPYDQEDAYFWYVSVEAESGKWLGPTLKTVDDVILEDSTSGSSQRFWVIEGDGAKGLKLKCWDPHEPQIPRRSDCVVLVLDGALWGRVLQAEHVHRPTGCLDLLGRVWNAEQAWRYFLRSPVFASQYEQMSWVILLNSKVTLGSDKPLLELGHRWEEIQQEVKDLKYRPNHLRLAAGDAKEGKLQWFDLW